MVGHDGDVAMIFGGGNTVKMQDGNSLTVIDTRGEADGFTGSVSFSDTIGAGSNNNITLDYSLALGNSDTVSVDFSPSITADASNTVTVDNTITAGSGYTGGNNYIGNPQDFQNGFDAIGTCANYAGSAIRVIGR